MIKDIISITQKEEKILRYFADHDFSPDSIANICDGTKMSNRVVRKLVNGPNGLRKRGLMEYEENTINNISYALTGIGERVADQLKHDNYDGIKINRPSVL